MPVSFQFTNRETGEVINLSQIDEEICKDFQLNCDPKHYSWIYDVIVTFGIGALYRSSEFKVTKEVFDTHLAACRQNTNPSFNDDNELFLRKYLYIKYEFHAWR